MADPVIIEHRSAVGGEVHVRLSGEIDLNTVDDVAEVLRDAVERRGVVRIVVDFAEVTFCDSTGIRVLDRAYAAAAGRDVAFQLVNIRPPIRRLLAIVGVLDGLAGFRPSPAGNLWDMFPAENLRDWRGEKVIDPDGDKIGDLEAIYVDTTTDEPSFATVRIGIIGRHRLAFVPLAGATVLPGAVRVRFGKKLVGDAPTIEMDGELTADDEPGVFAHYNLPYVAGTGGARRLGRR